MMLHQVAARNLLRNRRRSIATALTIAIGVTALLLFGGFLLWAVLCFRAARQRDRALGTSYPSGTLAGTGITVVLGGVAWGAFAFWGHALLIGISPLGR